MAASVGAMVGGDLMIPLAAMMSAMAISTSLESIPGSNAKKGLTPAAPAVEAAPTVPAPAAAAVEAAPAAPAVEAAPAAETASEATNALSNVEATPEPQQSPAESSVQTPKKPWFQLYHKKTPEEKEAIAKAAAQKITDAARAKEDALNKKAAEKAAKQADKAAASKAAADAAAEAKAQKDKDDRDETLFKDALDKAFEKGGSIKEVIRLLNVHEAHYTTYIDTVSLLEYVVAESIRVAKTQQFNTTVAEKAYASATSLVKKPAELAGYMRKSIQSVIDKAEQARKIREDALNAKYPRDVVSSAEAPPAPPSRNDLLEGAISAAKNTRGRANSSRGGKKNCTRRRGGATNSEFGQLVSMCIDHEPVSDRVLGFLMLVTSDLTAPEATKLIPVLKSFIAWRDKNWPEDIRFRTLSGTSVYDSVKSPVFKKLLFPADVAKEAAQEYAKSVARLSPEAADKKAQEEEEAKKAQNALIAAKAAQEAELEAQKYDQRNIDVNTGTQEGVQQRTDIELAEQRKALEPDDETEKRLKDAKDQADAAHANLKRAEAELATAQAAPVSPQEETIYHYLRTDSGSHDVYPVTIAETPKGKRFATYTRTPSGWTTPGFKGGPSFSPFLKEYETGKKIVYDADTPIVSYIFETKDEADTVSGFVKRLEEAKAKWEVLKKSPTPEKSEEVKADANKVETELKQDREKIDVEPFFNDAESQLQLIFDYLSTYEKNTAAVPPPEPATPPTPPRRGGRRHKKLRKSTFRRHRKH